MGIERAKKEAGDTVIKPDYSLIPKSFMDQVSYCMMAGEKKYGRYNFTKGHSYNQLTAAMVRHIKLFESGEDFDKDTTERVFGTNSERRNRTNEPAKQVSHLACVAANVLMLLEQISIGTAEDDRPSNPAEEVTPSEPEVKLGEEPPRYRYMFAEEIESELPHMKLIDKDIDLDVWVDTETHERNVLSAHDYGKEISSSFAKQQNFIFIKKI